MTYVPDLREIGPRFDALLDSPSFGRRGLFIKPGTYKREQQLIKRQDVIAALSTAIGDRDLNFWTRVTQANWRLGTNEPVFSAGDTTREGFQSSHSLDWHRKGKLTLVPKQTVLDSTVAAAIGRGALIVPQGVAGAAAWFSAWVPGKYRYSLNIANAVPTFAEANTDGAAGKVLDTATNGTDVFFALDVQGVWRTSASAPGNLTRYDIGATGPYHRLVWDPGRKRLYGITAPSVGARFEQINAGAAPTVIFDFAYGRLDAISMWHEYVYVGWNQGDASDQSRGRSIAYRYDGASVAPRVDFGDGAQIVGIKSFFGVPIMGYISEDPFRDTETAVVGHNFAFLVWESSLEITSGITDGRILQDSVTKSPYSSMQHWVGVYGTPADSYAYVAFFATGGIVWMYRGANGGYGRMFGHSKIVVGGTTYDAHIMGLCVVQGKMLALTALLTVGTSNIVGGAVWQISGSDEANAANAAVADDNKITGSRMDFELPYVSKFWYAWEVLFLPLIAGQQVACEYSIDDGATWVVCGNSPAITVGQTSALFTINKVNPHARYRLTLTRGAALTSPTILAVSGRIVPSNPNARVWTFTVSAMDWMRNRGEHIEDSYGKDTIDYLFNLAQKSEVVTFYEPGDDTRTARSVWVMTAAANIPNTSGEYRPRRHEGEVDVMLWETGS